MKKYFYVMLTLALFASSSCKKRELIKNDKKAIIATIEEETNAYNDKDFKRLKATYVTDKSNIRLTVQKEGYIYYEGWNKIEPVLKSYMTRMQGTGEINHYGFKIHSFNKKE